VSQPALAVLLGSLTAVLATLAVFLVYVSYRYGPIISRIFEEKPLFLPFKVAPEPGGEEVRFTTDDGLELVGTYLRAETPTRVGVVVFCHEFLSDRWSFQPYASPLRALGYDVFTFDFRSHGESALDPNYFPLQWVTDHEVNDLRAALKYLRARPDRDPAGFGLLGVSRGGGTALVVSAQEPDVWGVVTDGAFPTRGTMLAYILRWAEIYVSNPYLWTWMPLWVFRFVGWVGRLRSERRLNCRYPDVESAVAQISPRPWLMIHGEKDAYILPKIAEDLFSRAREPKEKWIVPKAKHNRCLEVDPGAYQDLVAGFLQRYAPRRQLAPLPPPEANGPDIPEAASGAERASRVEVPSIATGVPSPVSG
jgi:pimeloyl-ACP methyl ester carboxylesterase